MAEIFNLRTARKQTRLRDEARSAEQNRIIYGRAKAEKLIAAARAEKARRDLNAHRIERKDG